MENPTIKLKTDLRMDKTNLLSYLQDDTESLHWSFTDFVKYEFLSGNLPFFSDSLYMARIMAEFYWWLKNMRPGCNCLNDIGSVPCVYLTVD